MNLDEGDTLAKTFEFESLLKGGREVEREFTVKSVEDGYVELEMGEYVPISQIERDVKHDITRVIKE